MRKIATEELSAYLDHELDREQERDLEMRLAESPQAQRQLEELASVVQSVKALEGLEAPAELHQRIQRVLELAPEESGLGARLKKERARYLQFPPIIWAILGTVLALGVMTLVLADHRRDRDESTGVEVVGQGRIFETAMVDGVQYTLHEAKDGGGIWIPEGWTEESTNQVLRKISLSSEEGAALLPPNHPLRRLLEGTSVLPSAAVYLKIGGERVVVGR